MARFLGGLHSDIGNIVELQPFWTFEDVCKLAIKVEKQKKISKGSASKPYTRGTSFSKGFSSTKTETSSKDKNKFKEVEVDKEKTSIPQGGKKCFKCHGYGHFQAECPNRRVMTIKEMEEIESALKEEENKEEESNDDEEVIADPMNGELLVIRRSLHTKMDWMDDQRENIFQSRCSIGNKICSMIIDSGSCANVASTTLVTKLELPTTSHPKPYKLQWLNDGNQLKVTHQVLLSFSIGKHYNDEVLCDVIPMDVCHLLLGRSWQFDRSAIHDGRKNTYTIKRDEKKVVLTSLKPSQLLDAKT
ncbi:Asp_protease_2 domain-containing protein [Cephalotus follicularis]|uniref:Asp_protease_2 domain-containing protein n=1 Tax=Cephalotus follicularis TaxID=3775 RepID=A0A1Q3DHT5_CEPFO|nr:Asp_protease_2 domain-containing protein [Cephalotus follicularis]